MEFDAPLKYHKPPVSRPPGTEFYPALTSIDVRVIAFGMDPSIARNVANIYVEPSALWKKHGRASRADT